MIELEKVQKRYRTTDVETTVFDGLDLRIASGDLLVVTGESGSGKSTLLNMLGLIDLPDGGTYRIDGTPVPLSDATAVRRVRARRFGFVFQSFHLVDRLRTIDNVLLPIRCVRRVNGDDRRKAVELLRRVGLEGRIRHYPRQLSGGQQQRVAFARALVSEPDVILADEPTGNLDSSTSKEVMTLVEELNSGGTTVVLATHSREVAAIGRVVVELVDGELRDIV